MAFLRSDEDIKQEIDKLEIELIKYPTGPMRRKIKERIARLKRVDRERINAENRRRRLGMVKREPKAKKDENAAKVKKKIKPLVQVVQMEDYINKELAFIKADERLAKEKKSEIKNKIYCSSCGQECIKTYSNISEALKHRYYCKACANKLYGMFEMER